MNSHVTSRAYWQDRTAGMAERRRDDWPWAGVLSGFVATFTMTVVLLAAYGLAQAIGSESGTTLERWFWALTHNPMTRMTQDSVILASALNLLMGLAASLVYARLVEPMLAGPGWRKGIGFALVLWVLSVVAFLPVMGGGFLGMAIDAGPLPVLGNLILHLVYGAVLGAVYAIALEAGLDDTESERRNAIVAERGAAIGIGAGLLLGALIGSVVPVLAALDSRTAMVVAGGLAGSAIGALLGSLLGVGQSTPSISARR